MSLGENSLVAAYQGKGQLKSRPSGTGGGDTIIIVLSVNGHESSKDNLKTLNVLKHCNI